jgi:hypothetical protein
MGDVVGRFGVRSRDAPVPSLNTHRRLGVRIDSVASSGSVPSVVSRGVSTHTDTASRARFLGAILLLRSVFRLSALWIPILKASATTP